MNRIRLLGLCLVAGNRMRTGTSYKKVQPRSKSCSAYRAQKKNSLCGSNGPSYVYGSYIGEAELCIRGWWFFSTMENYMHYPTTTVRSVQSKGKQTIEKFEEGPREVLESTLNGGQFEQIGLALTTIQTNEEVIEANSVV